MVESAPDPDLMERAGPAVGGECGDRMAAPDSGRRPVVVRLVAIGALGLLIGGAISFVIGFNHFVNTIAAIERPNEAGPADAIVALTGGAERITDAIDLLGEGRARRLLISGVYPGTTRKTLANITPRHEELFFCCVDLGHSALNTVGNAKEARNWARGNGFRSLIVVTSSYHMPRSLNEIRREMPEADLIPYPVVTRQFAIDSWWRHPGTARLLLAEYTKYLMSIARLRVGGPATAIDITHAAIDG